MKNFWQDLQQPFSVLAPMDGVTDVVFRQIVAKACKPDVFFTEFTNCDGLLSKGKDTVMQRLAFKQNEQPIVAQIWGVKPESFYRSAKVIADLGFAGIDINMGCPDRTITKDGACSALITNPSLAKEIIDATKRGSNGLPVSVKSRIGKRQNEIKTWIRFLLEQQLAVVTIHLRTVNELSNVPAHWELMPEIVKLRNTIAPETILIGNGDVVNVNEGANKAKEYGIEGIMYGRAIFSDPFLFNKEKEQTLINPKEKMSLFLDHIQLFKQQWGTDKHFAILKKYCKIYVRDIGHAAEIREKIMLTESLNEMEEVVKKILEEMYI